MRKPCVALASLGGTITMTSPGGQSAGVQPTLDSEALLAAVPGLGDMADVEASTLASVPSASLRFSDVLGALDWAEDAATGGADGVVLVQGTDTLEETAYLLDLYWDHPTPLIVTGAMRSPEATGADGSANLVASVLTASARSARGLGALVVMNDVVHAASQVRKSHSTALDAFCSPSFGPLGYLHESRVTVANRPARLPAVLRPNEWAPRVALLETYLGDDGSLLDLAIDAEYDGVVIAAFGAGHVSDEVAYSVSKAIEVCPVVFATRTGAGTTLTETYGFVGSESDLISRGAIPAGWLDPRKARILLWSLLAASCSIDEIATHFARRGTAAGRSENGG